MKILSPIICWSVRFTNSSAKEVHQSWDKPGEEINMSYPKSKHTLVCCELAHEAVKQFKYENIQCQQNELYVSAVYRKSPNTYLWHYQASIKCNTCHSVAVHSMHGSSNVSRTTECIATAKLVPVRSPYYECRYIISSPKTRNEPRQ